MTAATLKGLSPEALARAQEDYLAALPRIREHAEVQFRSIRDPGRRDDSVATAVGIGWKHWLAAVRKGKDPNEFVSAVADFAVRQVRSGRRVDRQESRRDVLSPRAREVRVQSLPGSAVSHETLFSDPHGQEAIDAVEERLADNTQTPPPLQAEFREQWRLLMDRQPPAKRAVIEELATGADTQDVAVKFGKSPGRISQIRREAEQDWRAIDRLGDDCDRCR